MKTEMTADFGIGKHIGSNRDGNTAFGGGAQCIDEQICRSIVHENHSQKTNTVFRAGYTTNRICKILIWQEQLGFHRLHSLYWNTYENPAAFYRWSGGFFWAIRV